MALAASLQDQQMSYEEMEELGEQIGRVPRGFPPSEIEKIKWEIASLDLISSGDKCSICCEAYGEDDSFLQTICKH